MKKSTLATALTILLIAVNPSFAGPDNASGDRKNKAQSHNAIKKHLNLSDQQSNDLKALNKQRRELQRQVMAKHGIQKGKGKPKEQLGAEKYKSYRDEMKSLRENHNNNIAKILTPEQIEAWDSMRNKKSEKFK